MFDPRTETNKTTFFMHFVRSWFMLYRNNEIQEFNNMFVFVLFAVLFSTCHDTFLGVWRASI
jgi:hypothetical protein